MIRTRSRSTALEDPLQLYILSRRKPWQFNAWEAAARIFAKNAKSLLDLGKRGFLHGDYPCVCFYRRMGSNSQALAASSKPQQLRSICCFNRTASVDISGDISGDHCIVPQYMCSSRAVLHSTVCSSITLMYPCI